MSEFHFLRPWWLLALLPWALLLWQLWRQRQQGGRWERVCDPELLRALIVAADTRGSRWPARVLALAGGLAILALAGPTWQRLPTPVYQTDSALVVLFDLSRSMDAPDLAPDRLTRARFKLADFLQQRREGLTGLVVFAGEAFLAAPLSDDPGTVLHMIEGLETRLMPSQGSRLLPALAMADELFAGAGVRRGTLLLISDGDGLEPEAEQWLRGRPHELLILGVGTPEGAPIPVGDGFFKDEDGNIVVPRLDETRLQALAAAGQGRYVPIRADDADVRALLDASRPLAPEGALERDRQGERWQDMGPWLLLPLLPLAALAFRRGYLLLLLPLLLPPPLAEAAEVDTLWRNADQRGLVLMQAGDYERAAATFADPRWRAAALFRQGRWAEAEQALAGLDQADDWYNRGNALAAQERLDEAISAYQQALQREPRHADAAYNLARLRELKQDADASNPDTQSADQNEDSESDRQQREQADQDASPPPQSGRETPTPEDGETDPDSQNQPGQQSREGDAGEQASDNPAEQSGDGRSGDAVARRGSEREADEQWLRRIQEDPAELLRRKFMYLSRQRGANQDEERPW